MSEGRAHHFGTELAVASIESQDEATRCFFKRVNYLFDRFHFRYGWIIGYLVDL